MLLYMLLVLACAEGTDLAIKDLDKICDDLTGSCRPGNSDFRDCEMVCQNGTCEIRIAVILPNDTQYLVNIHSVSMTICYPKKKNPHTHTQRYIYIYIYIYIYEGGLKSFRPQHEVSSTRK